MRHLNGVQQILRSVIDAWNDVTESLGVCGPENDDFINAALLSEVTDVSADLCHLTQGQKTS